MVVFGTVALCGRKMLAPWSVGGILCLDCIRERFGL